MKIITLDNISNQVSLILKKDISQKNVSLVYNQKKKVWSLYLTFSDYQKFEEHP